MRPALTPVLAARLPLIAHLPPLALAPWPPEDEAASTRSGTIFDGDLDASGPTFPHEPTDRIARFVIAVD